MIQSMTGYGYAELQNDKQSITMEMKGYNNRYLDLQLSLPGPLAGLENELRNLLKKNFSRGRVELYLRVQSLSDEPEVRIDRNQARAITSALKSMKAEFALAGRVRLEHLLAFDGLVRVDKKRNSEEIEPLVLELFSNVVNKFTESRVQEGTATVADIRSQLERFKAGFAEICSRASEIEKHINQQIRERFDEILGDRVEEERLLTEVASLIVKHSINEEISRLTAHIQQFNEELSSAEAGGNPVGKRLDFLCQEMNRETNTIGSKNLIKEISAQVINMKDSVENIREQLRNIE